MLLALLTLFIGMISIQFGASVAKGLFPLLGPTGMTAWRLTLASIILLLLCRPWRFPLSKVQLKDLFLYGATLGLMNTTFYLALERIPLGVAVALEFTGPLSVAMLTSRRAQDFVWAILALVGLILLFPITTHSALDPFGVVMALSAGVCWAGYIVFGQRVSSTMPGTQAASLGMLVAALVAVPFGLIDQGMALWKPEAFMGALLVAVFSSALPYSLDMIALSRLRANTYSILMSLEPAFATLMGWFFLKEALSTPELIAIACIMAASLGSALTPRITEGNL